MCHCCGFGTRDREDPPKELPDNPVIRKCCWMDMFAQSEQCDLSLPMPGMASMAMQVESVLMLIAFIAIPCYGRPTGEMVTHPSTSH